MDRIKTFFSTLWYIRKTLFINLLAFAVITFVIIQILMWLMSFYTLHGESVEVPSLVNMTVEEAAKLLETRDLDFEVSDSVCRGTGIGGLIKDQTPKSQARVKESRKIYLTVTRYSECTVKLYYHQLIGRSRTYVVRQLERCNLKVGKMTYIPGGKAENTVTEAYINGVPLFIEADPDAGEKPPKDPKEIPHNAVVDLVLLEGLDAEPKFTPSLICGSYSEAEFTIKGSQFNLGTIYTQGSISDTLAAWVYKQSPSPGTVATMGTGIDLWLMQEYPKACDEVEEVVPGDEDTD